MFSMVSNINIIRARCLIFSNSGLVMLGSTTF
ncbi:MAG: hypothetical protein MRECE_56c001 [Mycoplasmataceae bacterium CE_OT135]|nr:MAG: hypothetical protein MRECE_56c001 [Mycoplasmataceae bacterium CE_OT135]